MDRLLEVGGDVTGVERGRLEEEELRRVSTILLKRKGRDLWVFSLWVFSDPKKERPLGNGRKKEKEERIGNRMRD